MEPDTHNSSTAPTENEAARSHFLESMGLGNISPAPAESSPALPEPPHQTILQAEREEESGVVLSSQPDDISLPGAQAKAATGARVVGVQVGSTAILNRVESLEASSSKEKASPEPVAPPKEEISETLPSIASLEEPPTLPGDGAPVSETPPPLEPISFPSEKVETAEEAPAMKSEEAAPAPESAFSGEVEPALPSAPESEVTEVVEKVEESSSVEEEAQVATGHVEEEKFEDIKVDINAPLHLFCPKCEGELILRREHLGVEGACVWCETKIVAAESGLDHEIRVFLVFQPDILLEKSGSEAPAPAKGADADSKEEKEVSDPLEPAPALEDAPSSEEAAPDAGFEMQATGQPSFSTPGESASAPEPESCEEEEDSYRADDSAAGSFSEAAGKEPDPAPSPVESGFADYAAGFENPIPAPSGEETDPVTNGFGAVAELEPPSPTPAASVEENEAPSGFADPLAGFASPAPAAEEPVDPIPSGFQDEMPSLTAGDKAAMLPLEPSPNFESDAAPTSFSAPATGQTSFSTPKGFSPMETAPLEDSPSADASTVEAGEPAEVPSGFTGGFGAELSMDAMPEPAQESTPEAGLEPAPVPEPAPMDSLTGWGAMPPAEMKAQDVPEAFPPLAAGSAEAVPSGFGAPLATEEPSIFSSSETPESSPLPVAGSHGGEAAPAALEDAAPLPEIPAPGSSEGGFSIPSANQSAAFTFGASLPAPAESPSVEADSAGSAPLFEPETTPTSAAVTDKPVEEESLTNSEKPLPAPWGESKPLVAPEPEEEISAKDLEKPLAAPAFSPPPIPGANAEPAKGGLFAPVGGPADGMADTPEGGTVEKSSIGKPGSRKEKRARRKLLKSGQKPRKGLIVFLVILIGFVCGAAAASFLLPIEDYIVKAQTLMQEKFDPAALAPILSGGGEAGAEAGSGNLQVPFPASAGTEPVPPVSPAPAAPTSTMPTVPES